MTYTNNVDTTSLACTLKHFRWIGYAGAASVCGFACTANIDTQPAIGRSELGEHSISDTLQWGMLLCQFSVVARVADFNRCFRTLGSEQARGKSKFTSFLAFADILDYFVFFLASPWCV